MTKWGWTTKWMPCGSNNDQNPEVSGNAFVGDTMYATHSEAKVEGDVYFELLLDILGKKWFMLDLCQSMVYTNF